MKKSDLSAEALARRARFVDRVRRNGWDPGGWETLFDADADLAPEAQAERVVGGMVSRLGLWLSEGFVSWECMETDGDFVISTRVFPAGELDPVLDVVFARQDRLDPASVDALLDAVRATGARVQIETDEGYVDLA